ncbi:BrnT family toxin [Alishewanella sp. d11]|uniref:BrnT family toxin n=1 Tax=Alishewanella sp. d11 TaxID=3414030 RepID=UPI003BF8617D
MYAFEFDNEKSLINLEKHGIDFIDAQLLWGDPYLIEIEARSTDEARSLGVGSIDGKM